MRLPADLSRAIEVETSRFTGAQIAAARERLTARYREGEGGGPGLVVETPVDRAAYLVTRAPATFAAVRAALAECAARSGGLPVKSLLDLGAGPGTAAWAAVDVWPSIERVTHVEIDSTWLDVGRRLGRGAAHPALGSADWVHEDLTSARPAKYDAVVVSYALGETDARSRETFVRSLLEAARAFVAIVEPGTRAGFDVVRAARATLVAAGARILAPCTHEEACPMAGADWCRFAARLERSKAHRRAKGASLGYEDEPYSYVVASTSPRVGPAARIVRPPARRVGHVVLDVCAAGGLRRVTVAKSAGDRYREARRAEWGGAIDA